ncbi:MAG: hypothetical protein CMJ18_18220 [Phycisphaeraceae bacterium]|nr:hypothetical protein [Phycisphaeraceae bacterium]
MKRIALILVGIVVLASASGLLWRRAGGDDTFYDTVVVRRGSSRAVLREIGIVTPRDPVLVAVPVEGTLEWIVEEDTWVDVGDRLYVINDDDALKQVTEARTSLLASRQELELARLRREHAGRHEQQKVDAARRIAGLERIRHTILATPPQGGRRLIELHEQLVPLEKANKALRREYERAQDRYQKLQDAYLEAYDAWQQQKDRLLQLQAKIDEHAVRVEAEVDETVPEQVEARDEAAARLAEAKARMEKVRAALPERAAARDAARAARDAAQPPRDDLRRQVAQREEQERKLYIELEIEKRGVELAKVQINRRIARLTLEENERKLREGRATFESGALSAAALEKLDSDVVSARDELAVLDEQIRIAARPAPAEELTEARLEMEQAEMKAARAEAARDLALAAIDEQIALLEAQIAEARHTVEYRSAHFPSVIEFNIRFLEKRLEALDEDETASRDAIEQELAAQRGQLARVRDNPPNVGRAGSAGIVKLVRRWGRTYHAGDRVHADHVIMRIYPNLNLDVIVSVNESDVRRIRAGMAVTMTVPALDGAVLSGSVTRVAGVGRDKFHESDNAAFAGVTEFEARVAFDAISEALRPGMTVVSEIELERVDDVLILPKGAVRRAGDRTYVLIGDRGRPRERDVDGRVHGDDGFIVERGLAEQEQVLVERRSSL